MIQEQKTTQSDGLFFHPAPSIPQPETAFTGSGSKRTLTGLYNQRLTWLDLAHNRLDQAVFAPYGWENTLSDEEILERLLALNLERAK